MMGDRRRISPSSWWSGFGVEKAEVWRLICRAVGPGGTNLFIFVSLLPFVSPWWVYLVANGRSLIPRVTVSEKDRFALLSGGTSRRRVRSV